MARRIVGWAGSVALVVAWLASAGPNGAAFADGREDGPPNLEQRVAELRKKAHLLRERGSAEDAEALAKKALLLEKVQALRHESGELERRGKELRANGHEEEAHRAMSESGRLWKRAEELQRSVEGKPDRAVGEKRARGEDVRHEEVRRKIHELEGRLGHLRKEGRIEEATETERLLALLRAAGAVERPAGPSGAHRPKVERAERVKKAIALLREAGLPELASLVERETKEITTPPVVVHHVVVDSRPIERRSIVVRTSPPGHDEVERLRGEIEAIRRQMEEIRAALRELRERR